METDLFNNDVASRSAALVMVMYVSSQALQDKVFSRLLSWRLWKEPLSRSTARTRHRGLTGCPGTNNMRAVHPYLSLTMFWMVWGAEGIIFPHSWVVLRHTVTSLWRIFRWKTLPLTSVLWETQWLRSFFSCSKIQKAAFGVRSYIFWVYACYELRQGTLEPDCPGL